MASSRSFTIVVAVGWPRAPTLAALLGRVNAALLLGRDNAALLGRVNDALLLGRDNAALLGRVSAALLLGRDNAALLGREPIQAGCSRDRHSLLQPTSLYSSSSVVRGGDLRASGGPGVGPSCRLWNSVSLPPYIKSDQSMIDGCGQRWWTPLPARARRTVKARLFTGRSPVLRGCPPGPSS